MDVKFDKIKTLNALLYVASRVQRKDIHKIFKIIYFADRQHLADWGRPITGDTYIAMEAGPVPSRMYDMLKIVRGDSYLPDYENLGSYSKYSLLSYDEIKEKSHDIAWRSTARDFAIKWDQIALEAGLDAEDMECLNEFSKLEAALS